MSATTTSAADPSEDRAFDGRPAVGSYGRVAAWLAKRVEVALATVDLTPPQYRVMGLLAEGSSAASGLADRLAVRRPSITAVVDGLVARGMVDRRQEDADRRRVALRLTEEGARTLAEADRALDAHLEAIADNLPSQDQATALRSLLLWGRAMAASRESMRQGAAPPEEDTKGASR
ncbi:MAG TPA: MarR family transcriptional regulator [Acidimicrobiales bacterium]|nr:MarR family transcriptional regulator [Acidimicrobiales bacterium]